MGVVAAAMGGAQKVADKITGADTPYQGDSFFQTVKDTVTGPVGQFAAGAAGLYGGVTGLGNLVGGTGGLLDAGRAASTVAGGAPSVGSAPALDAAARAAFNSIPVEAQMAYLQAGKSPVDIGTAIMADAAKGGSTFLGSLPKWVVDAAKSYGPSLASGLLSGIGSYLTGDAAKDASIANAEAQLQAARIAADAAKFRPVGVKTRFGESQFKTDPVTGYLASAGYTTDPTIKAQQDALLSGSQGFMDQFLGSRAATAPMGQTATGLMSLGNQYLATSPQAQAQKFMADQQALLASGRERDMAGLMRQLQAQGRMGLATGATTTGMGAANPVIEAALNAQRQQDLELAARATQGGIDYAKAGAGFAGLGGTMLRDMYGTQQAAYAPYQSAFGGAQTLEGLAQQPLDLGMSLGNTTTAANRAAGGLLSQGMSNAANMQAQANAYSPWGGLFQGMGNQIAQANTQPATGTFTLSDILGAVRKGNL